MIRLSDDWRPIHPQSNYLVRDVFVDETLVARIVDTTAEFHDARKTSVRVFEADLLRGEVWQTGDERFSDERSALASITRRLKKSI